MASMPESNLRQSDGATVDQLVAFSRGLVFWQESMVSLTQNLISFGVASAVALTFRNH